LYTWFAFKPARVPISLVYRTSLRGKDALPLLLYGYGSYGIPMDPWFSTSRISLLDRGMIFAIAHVRGGGDRGRLWYDAGKLLAKKNSFTDFIASAEALIDQRWTSKERLAVEGGSAGGLLVYGTLVHYPDFMKAAVAHVGYGDVLRTELAPNGEFNTTEFGTVKDSVQFRGMSSYSPYHHVKDGRTYPSVLALTGVNDPRVPAWETFKMVARLEASGSKNPVLMRVSYDSGHGIGTALSERDQQTADVMMFLFDRLGVKYRPVQREGKPGKTVPSL
jgi:prolyl oligopeptidase